MNRIKCDLRGLALDILRQAPDMGSLHYQQTQLDLHAPLYSPESGEVVTLTIDRIGQATMYTQDGRRVWTKNPIFMIDTIQKWAKTFWKLDDLELTGDYIYYDKTVHV